MDSVLFDANANPIPYKGLTILKNVEFYKMGQRNNYHAALRFENSNFAANSTTFSRVESVAIHQSIGWGVSVKTSSNIILKNVDVFSVTQIGVSLDNNVNVTADSLNVYGVAKRDVNIADNAADRESCFSVCAFTDDMPCTNTTVVNSIVAGCPYAGFLAPGYSCNDPVG
jgi:hypothetical protein